ncbi:MAG: rod shape-determining protein RodA [Flavobacteriaceae bacterium]|nr:rod shape-determining protein RodA [Flavobacteriaceae bacterium]
MKWTEGLDKIGLWLYVLIVLFGIANVYSVDEESGIKQAVWFGVSLVAMLSIFLMYGRIFETLAPILYIFAIVLLVGIFPFGKEINGQRNWYVFGPISLQPVEFVKIAISLMLASYMGNPDFNMKMQKSWLTAFALIGLPGILVLLQPDVGSLMVFIAFVIAMYREGLSGWLFVVGFVIVGVFLTSLVVSPIYVVSSILIISLIIIYLLKIRWDFANVLAIVAGLALLSGLSFGAPKVMEKLPKHQRERIEVLFKGEMAFRDTAGYNLLYSKTAIGSGELLGKGYREGSVTKGKFVPEQRTDYIFCAVGEEWGFVGSAILVICYAIYIIRIYILAERQKVAFSRVFGYCFASILLMHFGINIGMVMGLFPTVGIPLPYFSYGGSSLLAFSMMTAIFFKLNYDDQKSLV